ncbi:MAG: pseudouridine-5'-phosphate glycosidase [Candidatus Nanopelagicaceae bacterium]
MIRYSNEIKSALAAKAPIVALESTIIAHGLPRPKNLEVALDVQDVVRKHGATPATIAIIDGEINIGMEDAELSQLASRDDISKASIRDIPFHLAKGSSAATTVAATSHIARLANIQIFATGGLGGVHCGAEKTWDESADIHSLSSIPVIVVCAGAKSILDIPATLERLETNSVPIVGYQTSKFPGFYLADSGFTIEHQLNTPEEIAQLWKEQISAGITEKGLVVANPVINQMDPKLHAQLLENGLKTAITQNVSGKDVTPFLLEFFHKNSQGESLRVNIEIIKANAKLAAQISTFLV